MSFRNRMLVVITLLAVLRQTAFAHNPSAWTLINPSVLILGLIVSVFFKRYIRRKLGSHQTQERKMLLFSTAVGEAIAFVSVSATNNLARGWPVYLPDTWLSFSIPDVFLLWLSICLLMNLPLWYLACRSSLGKVKSLIMLPLLGGATPVLFVLFWLTFGIVAYVHFFGG
jgi:hypothetical protein